MHQVFEGWELLGLTRQLDELLNLLAIPPEQQGAAWTPPVDLVECPDRFVVRIDVPGVARADLRVTMARHRLRVSGRRLANKGRQTAAHCHRAERSHGGFFLEIRVPPGVVGERATALLRDGVLEIALPRCADDSQVIAIPITEEEP